MSDFLLHICDGDQDGTVPLFKVRSPVVPRDGDVLVINGNEYEVSGNARFMLEPGRPDALRTVIIHVFE